MALRNLGVNYETVAIAEIDKFAIKSYEAIHGDVLNLGDISQVETESIPEHDLFTYSFRAKTFQWLDSKVDWTRVLKLEVVYCGSVEK